MPAFHKIPYEAAGRNGNTPMQKEASAAASRSARFFLLYRH
jgi:hypothetical protein